MAFTVINFLSFHSFAPYMCVYIYIPDIYISGRLLLFRKTGPKILSRLLCKVMQSAVSHHLY